MSAIYNVIKRPIITEKGLTLKEQDRTLCFEVDDVRHDISSFSIEGPVPS